MSIVGVYRPERRKANRTPKQKLEDVCLEICQIRPFEGFDLESGKRDEEEMLVNAATDDEKDALLEAASAKGVDADELVRIIRKSRGRYRTVLKELDRKERTGGQ